MTRRIALLVLAALVAAACSSGQGSIGALGASPATRVLFIGNSYTYFSNLPGMFARLASARGRAVDAAMTAPGGWRLKDHWEKGEAPKLLAGSHWDYVVLQEQSTLGVNLVVDGKARVSSDEVFRPAALQWASAIKQAGAVPVFYLTWARQATPEDQDILTRAYESAAQASGARVAPVGLAWRLVRQQHPELPLFAEDGSHPSPLGTYLAACTFYAALFDDDPTGLPGKVEGEAVDLATQKVQTGKVSLLVSLPPDEARTLQKAAWQAWLEVK